MPRKRELLPSEGKLLETQEQARQTFAPWFGAYFEEGGQIRADKASHISKSGKQYVMRRLSLGSRDQSFVLTLKSKFGGHIDNGKITSAWSLYGAEAVAFIDYIKNYCPSRAEDIASLVNGEITSREKGQRKSSIIQRPLDLKEKYKELIKNPYFLAGVIDKLSFEEHDTEKKGRHALEFSNLIIQTTNKALLDTIGEIHRLEPKKHAEAGKVLSFKNRRGIEDTTKNDVYRLRLPYEIGEKLLQSTKLFSPLRINKV